MKNYLSFMIFFITIGGLSQNSISDCEALKEGTFEVYAEGKKVGVMYRMNNIQIEKYPDEILYVKLTPSKCRYLFRSYHREDDIDTVTFEIEYIKLKRNRFKYIAKPKYLNINYKDEGEVVRISDKVDKEIEKYFNNIPKKKM